MAYPCPAIVAAASAFNSLFEIRQDQGGYPRCGKQLSILFLRFGDIEEEEEFWIFTTFNSLFEIHNGLPIEWLENVLFTFNSLFEIRQVPRKYPRPNER